MHVKGIWKLHGIDSVTGKSRSANNSTFYDTYEEALAAAKTYCSRANQPCPGIVIYKAHTFVAPAKPIEPPLIVEHFEEHHVPVDSCP